MVHYITLLPEGKVQYPQLQLQHMMKARKTSKSYMDSLLLLPTKKCKKEAQDEMRQAPALWKSTYVIYHAHLESIYNTQLFLLQIADDTLATAANVGLLQYVTTYIIDLHEECNC